MHLLPVHPRPLLEDILRPQVAAIQAPMEEEEEATEAVKEEMAVVRTIIEARKEASLADVRPPRVIHDEITTAIPLLAQFRRIMAQAHHKVHLQVIVLPLAKQPRQDTVVQLLRQPPQTTQLRPLMATVLPLQALLAMVPQIIVMICLPMAARNNQMSTPLHILPILLLLLLLITSEIHIVLLSIVSHSSSSLFFFVDQ